MYAIRSYYGYGDLFAAADSIVASCTVQEVIIEATEDDVVRQVGVIERIVGRSVVLAQHDPRLRRRPQRLRVGPPLGRLTSYNVCYTK